MHVESALTFAAILPGLLVAHTVADHWVQTDHQASHKGDPGWTGRLNCAKHVASYTATTAVVTGLLWGLFALTITPTGFVVGQLVSATTHYIADRRTPLARLAALVPGKANFWRLGAPRSVVALADDGRRVHLHSISHTGVRVPWDNPSLGTGAYALDQAWHWGWLGVAALITALV